MSLPLKGIKVLDLSRLAAGNMVSHMLADYGADVIKVEKPGMGDDLRNWKVKNISHWWHVYSRNKRSIALDFKNNMGMNVLKNLIKSSDVFIENFVPGTLEKWGLEPKKLHKINYIKNFWLGTEWSVQNPARFWFSCRGYEWLCCNDR